MRWAALTAAGLFCLAVPAAAQFAGAVMTGFGGRCHHLTAFGRQLSRLCDDRMLSIRLPDGRAGFAFSTSDKALVAFTSVPTGTALERVTYVSNGDATILAARGMCTPADPKVYDAKIVCEADTDRGTFRVEFSSNGGSGVKVAP